MDENHDRKGKNVVIDLNDDISNDDSENAIHLDSDTSYPIDADDNDIYNRGSSGNADEEKQFFYCGLQKNLDQLNEEDVFQLQFASEEEGEIFYNMYAKVMGFSIRRDELKLEKNKNNMVVSRRWVCSRQGYRAKKYFEQVDRQREPRALTRVGCEATLRIRYDRGLERYIVTHFVKKHNHVLADYHQMPFLRSHRSIRSPEKAQTRAMRAVGIKTRQIMDFMVNQSGSYETVGFTKKDLYNHIDAERKEEMKDGDAEGALAYMCAKSENDPLFYYRYEVDNENCLHKLFWADSTSRLDFACFGDVLVFDSTYRTNIYNKPFVILAGVNHHYQTTIFGCALVADETIDTYIWVLETLLFAMNNKEPISVVTDGDKAMRKAIKKVFPNSHHRLCKWHLQRNAVTNVHVKNFSYDFERCMSMECTREEFDIIWEKMVEDHELQNNQWIAATFKKRRKWAEAYLRGNFFAGMKSTQRSECMNAIFKDFLKTRLRLYEFVRNWDRAIAKLRHNEVKADHDTEQTFPVLCTALMSIEKHAANVLTRSLFFKFREEIRNEAVLFVVDRINYGGYRNYYLSKYTQPNLRWNVLYYPEDSSMKCSCLKFESFGLPCCHMVAIMKVEHLKEVPSSCIMKRWTKDAKCDMQSRYSIQTSTTVTEATRYSILSSSCNEMCYYGSYTTQGYDELKDEIARLTYRMKNLCKERKKEKDKNAEQASTHFAVCDPKIVRSKGKCTGGNNQRKTNVRRCSHCRCIGHTKLKCPKLSLKSEGAPLNEENDTSEKIPLQRTWDASYPVHYADQTGMTSSIAGESVNAQCTWIHSNTIDLGSQDHVFSYGFQK